MFKPQLKSPLRNSIMRALLAGNSTPSVPSFYFNFSNPSNVTLGAAQARGTITSTQNAHITMSASLSRVVGVAPLYVNIDMTGTTSDLTANATHDLFYSVNWGDPGAGQWANGVQSAGLTDKNWSFGPVGGHVFETPGTYLVTPTSTDGVNSAAKPGYVTVLDPNVVYDPAYGAGYETICLSHSGNYTGAPGVSGNPGVSTRPVITGNTDMYALFNTYKGSNKRILFCKADNWTCSAQLTFNNLSGMTIGGYGTGVPATFGAGTMVSVTPSDYGGAAGSSVFNVDSGNSDLRICNIRINSKPTVFASFVNATMAGMLYYKVEFRGGAQGWNVTASQNPLSVVPEQVCLYECLTDEWPGEPFIDQPTSTGAWTIGTPGVVTTSTAHQLIVGRGVIFTDFAPSGLAIDTSYNVIATNFTSTTFSLSLSSSNLTPLNFSNAGSCTARRVSISGGVGAYVALTRGGIMGCYFDNCNNGEQTVRIPYIDRGHINNNYIARSNQTKNILKIHSVAHDYFPVWSEKFVVQGNVFDLRGGYSYNGTTVTAVGDCSMVIGNGGPSGPNGEWVRNGIVECNFTYSCLGNPKDDSAFAKIACPNMTVRNNIADFSVGDRLSSVNGTYPYTAIGMVFLSNGPAAESATVDVRIYNNTMYSNLANPQTCQFVRTFGDMDLIKIKNNIWYLKNRPEDFEYGIIYNGGGLALHVDASNNTASHLTSPNFVATPPVVLTDWKPTAGSYAINTGATVPVLRDFNNASRVGGTYDLGAVLP